MSRAEWAELARGWFPELVDARARSRVWPAIDAHRQRIGEMLEPRPCCVRKRRKLSYAVPPRDIARTARAELGRSVGTPYGRRLS